MSQVYRCWQCGAELTGMILPVSRREECDRCRAEIHACRMCVNYDPRVSEQCREDRAEPPGNKETANFCDWFKPDPHAYGGDRASATDDARRQLDALFGGDDGADADSASGGDKPSGLDDLFK